MVVATPQRSIDDARAQTLTAEIVDASGKVVATGTGSVLIMDLRLPQ